MAHVTVPASSANLGAGFDCVGIAVDRRLSAEVILNPDSPAKISITRGGSLAGFQDPAEKDLLYIAFNEAVAYARREYTGGLHFNVTSHIPVARGLGSSAAAIVAGASLANEALELGLGNDDLLQICGSLEGHPDNVAPAIFGGAILGLVIPGQKFKAVELTVHDSLSFIFAVPSFTTETKKARSVLPPVLPYSKAVLGISRAGALVKGLETGDGELLALAFDDVIHVPYRKGLINFYEEVTSAAVQAGAFGATLSGSGSTLAAVAPRGAAARVCECMKATWEEAGYGCEAFVSDSHPVPGVAVSAEKIAQLA